MRCSLLAVALVLTLLPSPAPAQRPALPTTAEAASPPVVEAPPQPSVPINVPLADCTGQLWEWPNAAELHAWIAARDARLRPEPPMGPPDPANIERNEQLARAAEYYNAQQARPNSAYNPWVAGVSPRPEYPGRRGFLRFRVNRRGC